ELLAEVAELLRAGKKINAIKRYREETGLSLKEAKDAVDALEAGGIPASGPSPAPSAAGDDEDIRDFLRAGKKIQAIKVYRERYGVGLKQAKDAVERM
ncbi:MAG TPA: 50S ribosomal protein L7/L12, partial [Planctomycetes bacterium]|nr:50S ribosomal protein L7/L12 [Planctomycetota bacterium]